MYISNTSCSKCLWSPSMLACVVTTSPLPLVVSSNSIALKSILFSRIKTTFKLGAFDTNGNANICRIRNNNSWCSIHRHWSRSFYQLEVCVLFSNPISSNDNNAMKDWSSILQLLLHHLPSSSPKTCDLVRSIDNNTSFTKQFMWK